MKIAIVEKKGSFSDKWITYCQECGIDYKVVNPYSNSIISDIEDCDVFMWHHHHNNCADPLFAKQLLYSIQASHKIVFPDYNTTWHFDDKVGQKYLLESINAPLVPSYVFYNKFDAMNWVAKTSFPKVFKLRGGAGASNVTLVHDKHQANHLIKRAFGRGFGHNNALNTFKERLRLFKEGKHSFMIVLKGIVKVFFPGKSLFPPEKGYAYFQDFIPNNTFDLRVVVIGNKALCEKRYCRTGDFRASGSGKFEYVKVQDEVLKIAFETAKRLKLQSVAFDFILDKGNPLIVEMSYAFGTHGISHCPGYYTDDLIWHDDPEPKFCDWIIGDLITNNNR